jgi:hypothetical protein
MIEGQGFQIDHVEVGMHAGGTCMEVLGWMNRIGTPDANREELLGSFFDAGPDLVEALEIERENDVVTFSLPEMTLLAHRR